MMWLMYNYGNIAYKKQYPQGIGGVDMFKKKRRLFATLLTKSYFLVPILVYCIFAAIRYKVGVDCENYKTIFYDLGQYGYSYIAPNIEPGFKFIANLVYDTTGSHYLFLFILAFLQIVFLYYAQINTTYSLKYFGIALMLTGTYAGLMNGIRQYIAACVLVAIISMILNKKNWVWFIAATLLATLMHKSALLIILIGILSYVLLKKGILNIYLQFGIIAICYLLMDKIDIPFLDFISSYGEQAGYDSETIDGYTSLAATTKNFGFSSWLILLSQLVTIRYSQSMQTLNNNKASFNIIYNLFFIGVCISLLFYNNFTIERLNYYFIIFYPITLSIALFVMSNSTKKIDKHMFYTTILILSTNFMYNLYKASTTAHESLLYKFDLFR